MADGQENPNPNPKDGFDGNHENPNLTPKVGPNVNSPLYIHASDYPK